MAVNSAGYTDLKGFDFRGKEKATGKTVRLLSGKSRGVFGIGLLVDSGDGPAFSCGLDDIELDPIVKTRIESLLQPAIPGIRSTERGYRPANFGGL